MLTIDLQLKKVATSLEQHHKRCTSKKEKLLQKLANASTTFAWTDLVSYEAKDLAQLKREFQISVDDYLAFCDERGKEPNKPFKGTFNGRTGSELHRAAEIASGNQSLNAFVCDAIIEKVERLQV